MFKHKISYKARKNLVIVGFLMIPVALLILFVYLPGIKLLELSLYEWDGATPYKEFTGFKNYVDLFKDKDTLMTFQNNLAYVIASCLQIVVSFYLAVILNSGLRLKKLFRSVVFLPYVLNGVAVAFMFSYLYDYQEGPLNVLLRAIGLGEYAVSWLGTGYSINFALAFIGVWRFTGLNVVIFLGALQSVSDSFYEAASIDGAGFFQKIRFITIPLMKPVIGIQFFLSMSGAMQAFFEPYVITQGGPAGRSSTFAVSTMDIAFKYNNFGKASAMGVVLFSVILLIYLIQRQVLKNKGGEA